MVLLTPSETHYWRPEFRIYVECSAELYDVRLDGRGVPYVIRIPSSNEPVYNEVRNPTAYDRVDDRE